MTKRTSLTPIRVMKFVSILAALTAFVAEVSSHYTFPGLILGGVTSSDWQYVRQTNNYQSLNPVTDVTTDDIRCYTSMELGTAPSTATVAAGSTIGFSVPITMYHDSVVNVYMAQAPAGTDVASWDGSGEVWFKVYEIPAIANGVTIEFPATPQATVVFTVPSELPSGQYLIRVENIALHVAQTFGGAQFYIGCAQVDITNGGNGTPGPLVAFPGAYTGNEPGILINIYFPIPTTYIQPGPPVWPASGSSGPTSTASSTSTVVKTTSSSSTVIKTTPPVSTKTTVSTSSTKASSTTTSTGPTSTGVAEFGQCGGQGFNGATTCQSPFVCTVLNPYYSQCT